jgi:hypothetical protein
LITDGVSQSPETWANRFWIFIVSSVYSIYRIKSLKVTSNFVSVFHLISRQGPVTVIWLPIVKIKNWQKSVLTEIAIFIHKTDQKFILAIKNSSKNVYIGLIFYVI